MNYKYIVSGLMALSSGLAVMATPLTLELRDGSKLEIESTDLDMTFDSGMLKASWNSGVKEIPVSQLSSFYFQSTPSGLEESVGQESFEVFSIDGCSLGRFDSLEESRNSLSEGLYIIKSQSGTFKTSITR